MLSMPRAHSKHQASPKILILQWIELQ